MSLETEDKGLSNDFCEISPIFRPRGALARALYDKHLSDRCLEHLDKSQWYKVETTRLKSWASECYVQMEMDDETNAFLDNSSDLSDRIFTQIFHSLVKFILGFFMTQTSINGWLGRGSMFVFSSRQLGELLARIPGAEGRLLDLGAGDGATTQVMASYFSDVTVTEVSGPMKKSLAARGFRVLDPDGWTGHQYDVISCLNLLDRCDRPITLLKEIRDSLTPNGKAIVALVLPFKPYVEVGKKDHKPSELMKIQGQGFETQAESFAEEVLIPAGFKVDSWTRLPYLCEGDLHQAYYWLDDAVFVLSKTSSDTEK